MKTIIVTTDFSKEAENALEYAGALAQQLKTRVIIFNAFVIPIHISNSAMPASVYQELLNYNKNTLKERARQLAEKYSIEVGHESGLLEIAEGIDNLIAKYDAALVIMGMASKSIEQDLFGNTTTSLIMKLKYPVLAIPNGKKFEGIKRILFACDDYPNHTVLDKISSLSVLLDAEVEIFHVSKQIDKLKQDSIYAGVNVVLDKVPHTYKNVESANVIKEIELEVNKINADLLIMVPHKYGFLESMVHRSKTRIMASNNCVPLLSVPVA